MLEKIFSTNIKLGTESDKRVLSGLANHKEMGSNVPLVYIFSLGPTEMPIAYPKGEGKTVYIGETNRELGSGRRFQSHICSSLSEGLSTQINHTLSVYYHLGRQLHLQVHRVIDGRSTKNAERILLRTHLHTYGANPIGQGGTGRDNSPKEVSRLYNEYMELHQECGKLFEYVP